jgi:putative transposase
MQVRWNYKLQPNKGQSALMSEWLVTLRMHRNYCLKERKRGFEANNQHNDQPVCYGYASYCDLDTRMEVGAFSPLTCPAVKHGVMSAGLTKQAGKEKKLTWGSVSDVQSKRTTELRSENYWYGRVASIVLQGNLAKLDAAYSGFFSHKRGFPAIRKASNFNSFQFKPGHSKLTVNRSSNHKKCYSHVSFPGIGNMRYLDSRAIPVDSDIRTITVMKEADGWYMSVLLVLADELPNVEDRTIKASVGIDVGINKLVSLSDGSFIENPKFSTNKKSRRQLRIRQRRVNRKVKGSNNRREAGLKVAKLHKKIADKRSAYQWAAANKIVNTADAIVREDLNIKGMKSRCKVKRSNGRAMPNGQSAKRGLNRSISDAAWGGLFDKVGWLAAKQGKPVLPVNPRFTSQECSACGHVSKLNRDGEKFVCESCGHIDHADTQASRTINKRAGFEFRKNVRKDVKILGADCPKVTAVRYESALTSKRVQGSNRPIKAMPENRISREFRQLSLFSGESPSL